MSHVLMGSYIALWILVLFLALTVAALARQIGILYRRISPSGARMLNAGPQIGDALPAFTGLDIYGNRVNLLGTERNTLLMFLSVRCSVCDGIIPALKSLARQERDSLNVVLASFTENEERNRQYAEDKGLSHLPYIRSVEFAHQLNVLSVPYAILIDKAGIIRSKGLVNDREHLESLLNSLDGQYKTVQAFWEGQRDRDQENGKAGSPVVA
jgi:methylamine dehydrogenase accessory protein MauD